MSTPTLNNNDRPGRSVNGTHSTVPQEDESPSDVTMHDTLMGTDPPIEEAHPGLQPTLVFASYPIVLIIVITIFAIYFALSRYNRSNNDAQPNLDALPTHVEVAK